MKAEKKQNEEEAIKESGENDVEKVVTAREREIARLLEEEQKFGENIDKDDEAVWSLKKAQMEKPSRQCPYLDTIDRYRFHRKDEYVAKLLEKKNKSALTKKLSCLDARSILISRSCAQYRYRTSMCMHVWFVDDIFK